MIRELWGIPAKAWWNSPDDPNIRLLKVTPFDAQYWDAPGATVARVKMATAALTGARPSMEREPKSRHKINERRDKPKRAPEEPELGSAGHAC